MNESLLFRDHEYGAFAAYHRGDKIVTIDHNLVREDRDAALSVLSRYGRAESVNGSTSWSFEDAHPAAVLSTLEGEMRMLGYEPDSIAERALSRVPVAEAMKPDLPAVGKVIVHDAVEQGLRRHFDLVSAALRESGRTSAPSVQFFPRPNAAIEMGRKPPFAVARIFTEGDPREIRERVVTALDPVKGCLVKVSVQEGEDGRAAVEIGFAPTPEMCEELLEERVPAFEGEIIGAREVAITLQHPLSEEELRDVSEFARGCTAVTGLRQEGNTLLARVPASLKGSHFADHALRKRMAWLSEVLDPWGPEIDDISEVMGVTAEPHTTKISPMAELEESIGEATRFDIRDRFRLQRRVWESYPVSQRRARLGKRYLSMWDPAIGERVETPMRDFTDDELISMAQGRGVKLPPRLMSASVESDGGEVLAEAFGAGALVRLDLMNADISIKPMISSYTGRPMGWRLPNIGEVWEVFDVLRAAGWKRHSAYGANVATMSKLSGGKKAVVEIRPGLRGVEVVSTSGRYESVLDEGVRDLVWRDLRNLANPPDDWNLNPEMSAHGQIGWSITGLTHDEVVRELKFKGWKVHSRSGLAVAMRKVEQGREARIIVLKWGTMGGAKIYPDTKDPFMVGESVLDEKTLLGYSVVPDKSTQGEGEVFLVVRAHSAIPGVDRPYYYWTGTAWASDRWKAKEYSSQVEATKAKRDAQKTTIAAYGESLDERTSLHNWRVMRDREPTLVFDFFTTPEALDFEARVVGAGVGYGVQQVLFKKPERSRPGSPEMLGMVVFYNEEEKRKNAEKVSMLAHNYDGLPAMVEESIDEAGREVPCADRLKHHMREPRLDDAAVEASRASDLCGSLHSAIKCREREKVEQYLKLVRDAIAKVTADVRASKQAFDLEDVMRFPQEYGRRKQVSKTAAALVEPAWKEMSRKARQWKKGRSSATAYPTVSTGRHESLIRDATKLMTEARAFLLTEIYLDLPTGPAALLRKLSMAPAGFYRSPEGKKILEKSLALVKKTEDPKVYEKFRDRLDIVAMTESEHIAEEQSKVAVIPVNESLDEQGMGAVTAMDVDALFVFRNQQGAQALYRHVRSTDPDHAFPPKRSRDGGWEVQAPLRLGKMARKLGGDVSTVYESEVLRPFDLDEQRPSLRKIQHDRILARALAAQGTSVTAPIDRGEYPEIPGLEGPFRFRKSGRILYYDPKAGKYYDSKSDLYVPASYAESLDEVLTKDGRATIAVWLEVLKHLLIQHDRRESKSHPNQYRLGILLKAKQGVEDDVRRYLDDDSEQAISALRKSLRRHFTYDLWGKKSSSPPVANLERQIDRWLSDGLEPSITGRQQRKRPKKERPLGAPTRGPFFAESLDDPIAYTAALAGTLKRLKRDLGATNIRQNYKGTGSKKHRRQLYVDFPNAGGIDIWLENGFAALGGVLSPISRPPPIVKYRGRDPKEVYRDIADVLRMWLGDRLELPEPKKPKRKPRGLGEPMRGSFYAEQVEEPVTGQPTGDDAIPPGGDIISGPYRLDLGPDEEKAAYALAGAIREADALGIQTGQHRGMLRGLIGQPPIGPKGEPNEPTTSTKMATTWAEDLLLQVKEAKVRKARRMGEGAAWGRFSGSGRVLPLDVQRPYMPAEEWEDAAAALIRGTVPTSGKTTLERAQLLFLADALERRDMAVAKRFYRKLSPAARRRYVTVAARDALEEARLDEVGLMAPERIELEQKVFHLLAKRGGDALSLKNQLAHMDDQAILNLAIRLGVIEESLGEVAQPTAFLAKSAVGILKGAAKEIAKSKVKQAAKAAEKQVVTQLKKVQKKKEPKGEEPTEKDLEDEK